MLGVHQHRILFGLPKDSYGNTGNVVFVYRLSNMAHLATVPYTVDGEGTATLFIDRVFRQHGLPLAIISDRDHRFTGKFWKSVFKVLGTRLDMPTADHPQTDGQTERMNRVIGDVLRMFALIHQNVGDRCSLSFSMRLITLFMPLQDLLRSK